MGGSDGDGGDSDGDSGALACCQTLASTPLSLQPTAPTPDSRLASQSLPDLLLASAPEP